MKLETKLGFGTSALVLAMVVSAVSVHVRVTREDLLLETTATRRMPTILSMEEAREHLKRSIDAQQSYLLAVDKPEEQAALRAVRLSELEGAYKGIVSLETRRADMDLGEDVNRMERMRGGIDRLRSLQERVETLSDRKTPEDLAAAAALLKNDILALDQEMYTETTAISESALRKAEADAMALRQANHRTLLTLWMVTLVGALAGLTVSALVARKIADAVRLVADRANAIAAGDLTGEPLTTESQDQISGLAEAMNRMQGGLGAIIGTVVDTAGSLTGSAVSMRTASDEIHKRIDLQSQQTQQAATAMQEMSASIAEVSRHTQSAAETARNAAQTARDGGAIVKQVLGSMHSIATAVSETSETVGLLGEDSKRISQIVTVIDEIARKTNLLALNAAIEAARAGDQGRGFAVVAGEVRRLAESTAQATGEIGTMIREIQERTRIAIASMNAGTGTVQEGVLTTTQAGEALEKIIGMAERVDRMITQIAIAASQQATAADQSSASLDSIHSLSHENLTEMATTAAGIEGLRGTAVRLERQVDRFQVMHKAG